MADDDYGDDFEEEEVVEEDVEELKDELEPPKLDEPVYHVGDVVEVRSPGRHGWHEGKVSSADFGQGAPPRVRKAAGEVRNSNSSSAMSDRSARAP